MGQGLKFLGVLGAVFAVVMTIPAQTKNPQSLERGSLLVASRDMGDSNFAQTVILLVQYNSENVLGLVLNRRSEVPLSKALEGLKAAEGRTDPIYIGGPVDPSTVFALLRSPKKVEGAEPVFGDIYLVTKQGQLERTIAARRDPGEFHVYVGYAGWTNEQLKKEVELGAWFVFRSDAAEVFDADPDTEWTRMIRKTEQKLARADVRVMR